MITNYTSNNFQDSFDHIGNCASPNKPITQNITIDDGTGKLYTYSLTKNLEWKEYTITPDFNTNPLNPTIIDNTQIIPNITDSYNIIDTNGVDYNFYADGTQLNNQKTQTINQILSVPRTQQITQDVRYFTGWITKTDTITKTINKTNIAPSASNEVLSSCYTVPVEIYTSTSTDQEDNPQNLTIDWNLYLDTNSTISITTDIQGNEVRTVIYDINNENWVLQSSKINNPVFTWTYNTEGRYKLIETATDTDGASTNAERLFDIVFKACIDPLAQSEQTVQASGVVEVEANVWQLIAIPQTTGYWDNINHIIRKDSTVRSTIKNIVIDQIEDIYGVPASDLIKVANCYFGNNNAFLNYIPGLTKDTSVNNFPLVYTDNNMDVNDGITKFEVTGFWIKAKNRNFTFKWGIL